MNLLLKKISIIKEDMLRFKNAVVDKNKIKCNIKN